MKITQVKIDYIVGYPRLKGIASIVLDDMLAINDIKIIQAQKGMCVEFPNINKNKFGIESIAPLNAQTRQYLQSAILDEYQSLVSLSQLSN